jgi:hypothetical protein
MCDALKLQSVIEASNKVPLPIRKWQRQRMQQQQPQPLRLPAAPCVCPRSSFSCFNMPAACSPQPSCTVRLLSGPRACSLCLCCPCERLRLPPQLLLLL